MRVDDETGAEDGIHEGIEGARGEGGDGKGDESDGHDSVGRQEWLVGDKTSYVMGRKTSQKTSGSYRACNWGRGLWRHR